MYTLNNFNRDVIECLRGVWLYELKDAKIILTIQYINIESTTESHQTNQWHPPTITNQVLQRSEEEKPWALAQ